MQCSMEMMVLSTVASDTYYVIESCGCTVERGARVIERESAGSVLGMKESIEVLEGCGWYVV